jgi:hypothetical protein
MDYAAIQQKLDYGRGKVAARLGPPHNVYRITSQDSDGKTLIDANKIGSNINAYTKVAYGTLVRTSFEGDRQQGIIWYDVMSDMSPYLLNDVFELADLIYGLGYAMVDYTTTQYKGFSLSDHSPAKKAIGGRLTTTGQFYRMNNQSLDEKKRFGSTKQTGLPQQVADGIVSLGSVGATAAQFPIGLAATGRSQGAQEFSTVPGDQKDSGYVAYVPAFQGLIIRDGDRLVAADGSSYNVIVPYVQYVGATGWQLLLEREGSGPG